MAVNWKLKQGFANKELTAGKAAKKINMKQGELSQLVNGYHPPSIGQLAKLSKLFSRKELEEIFKGSQSIPTYGQLTKLAKLFTRKEVEEICRVKNDAKGSA